MEHEPLPEPGRSAPLGSERVDPDLSHDPASAVHLTRFNVLEVGEIEQTIATHLGVALDHVAPEGFVVVPEVGGRMRIWWESSAVMDISEFREIVGRATAANERSAERGHLPEPHGPIARPRRRIPRRARRAAGGEAP